jgi:hypothetical protein
MCLFLIMAMRNAGQLTNHETNGSYPIHAIMRFGMYIEVHLGDIVRLRKKHPCGSDEWEVVRLGADIGLVCQKCRRRILLPRGDFNKQFKSITIPTQKHE